MKQKELQEHLNKHGVNLIIGAYGELPDCVGLLEKPPFDPPEGGRYTKFIGCSYLFKGYPSVGMVQDLAVPKKIIKIILDRINTWFGKLVVGFLFILPGRLTEKVIFGFLDDYSQIISPIVKRYLFPPKIYCNAVREINRALEITIDEFFDGRLRDLVHSCLRNNGCMVLEADAAYKFRVQELLSLIDQRKLVKSPVKELSRVFDIFRQREKGMATKMAGIKKIIWFLRFHRFALKFIVRFLTELNLRKVKLDEADWYYCLLRPSHDFGGMSFKARKAIKEMLDKEKGHKIPKVVFKEPPEGTPVGTLKAAVQDRESSPVSKIL